MTSTIRAAVFAALVLTGAMAGAQDAPPPADLALIEGRDQRFLEIMRDGRFV